MSETITASLTVSGGDTITAEINTLARGPAGPTGASGASTWDDITGTASDVPFLPVAAPAHSEGLVFYDSTDKSLTYYNDEADVSMNIGRELWVRVRNDSGSPILNGKVVYINDAIGQLPTIRLARADSAVTSRVIGIATHDIGNNEFGYVTTTGEVKGLATNAFDDGDLLFLSAVTAGEMTTTAPLAPNRVIQVATVLHAHPTQGKLYCHPETDSIPSTGIVDSTATGRALITAATQSDARTTGLGATATGTALFVALDAAAARTTLELGAFSTNGSITGTGALTFTAGGSNQNINLTPSGSGLINITGNSGNTVIPVFRATNNYSGGTVPGYVNTFECLAPNLSAGNAVYIPLGVSATTNNRASIVFYYAASGSSNNYLSFGNFFGATGTLAAFPNGGVAIAASGAPINPGAGCLSVSGNVGIGTTSPSALLDVNSNTVRVRTARTPASATAAGNAGDICWDANYIYVCVATNTWKRTAISTWP